MNAPRTTRLSYEQSCQLLVKLGFISAQDFVGGSLPFPKRRPEIDDEPPLGLTFYKTWVGNGQPFGLAPLDPAEVEEVEKRHLENLTLPRTFFGRSEISRISFQNTDLSESTLCWNDFIEVDFTDANLSGSDLRAAIFERVVFVRTNLKNADLRRSTFKECDFTSADLSGAKLTREGATKLNLTETQKGGIDWQESDGEEPSGG